MNTVLLELNSYTQEAKIFLNGKEPSPYSELKNYKYKQLIDKPNAVFEAIARELNDDFTLSVVAPNCIYAKIAQAAEKNEYCEGYAQTVPMLNLSTQERFAMLGSKVPGADYNVLLTNSAVIPGEIAYGPVSLSFTADEDADADFQINFIVGGAVPPSGKGYVNIPIQSQADITAKLCVDICEAYYLNPLIGKFVAASKGASQEIAVCNSLSPVITANFSNELMVGDSTAVSFTVYPKNYKLPGIVLESSNPDVITTYGTSATALAAGEAEIRAYVKGTNTPFFTKKIVVEEKLYAERIEIEHMGMDYAEGSFTHFVVNVYPENAADKDRLVYELSNDNAIYQGSNLITFVKAGEVTLTVKGEKTFAQTTFSIIPETPQVHLSETNLSLNIGAKSPITITTTPEGDWAQGFTWFTSDDTVATVVEENGEQYIKAVGIGSCDIVCRTNKCECECRCQVTVQSALYQKQPKRYLTYAIIAVVLLLIFFPKDKLFKAKSEVTTAPAVYENATYIDVFEELAILFTGREGEGKVLLTNESKNPLIQGGRFSATPSDALSNGQEVVVKFTFNEDLVEEYGYAPKATEKTVTVAGLSSYITSYKDVPQEFIDAAKEANLAWITEKAEGISEITDSTYAVECCGVYFQAGEYSDHNVLVVIVAWHDTSAYGGGTTSSYVLRKYENIGLDENGDITNDPASAQGVLAEAYGSLTDAEDALYETDGYITVKIE